MEMGTDRIIPLLRRFLRWRGTASVVKNQISYVYIEVTKHQHTNYRTNSLMQMSLGAHCNQASSCAGLRWSWVVTVLLTHSGQGALAISRI